MIWRNIAAGALLAPAALGGAAQAAPRAPAPYTLLGYALSGSPHIDAAALVAALPHHAGDRVTDADIAADEKRIEAALTARFVHFSEVTTALLQQDGPGRRVWVLWDIQHDDALAQARIPGPYTLLAENFVGNRALTADKLAAASALRPGDRLKTGSIAEARTGIEQAYHAAFPGGGFHLDGKLRIRPDGHVILDWIVTEPKA